jgi:AraC-like DNA-binding protein
VGLSRSVFAHRFRRLVGVPMTYLTRWRMQKALDLLSNPDCTLSAIAADVGYSSEITFSKAFKHFFHKSPGEVRKHRDPWK